MPQSILILNAGSSSLKFSVFANRVNEPELILRGQAENLLTAPHFSARDAHGSVLADQDLPHSQRIHDASTQFLLGWLATQRSDHRLFAAGHRVVHGGREFTQPVRIDDAVLNKLEALVPLAPLHQPHNISAIRALAKLVPQLPQIACFDTAFHRTQPALAQQFAIPRDLTDRGIIRYGMHGISYEYIASILPSLDPRAANGKTIVAHLGNGASLCAMIAGKCIATTMSFTALDGLPMGTRCGAIDPGVLLYLLQSDRMAPDQLEDLLYNKSGLLGVSGISSDVRTLLASRDPRARQAIDLFVYRIGREIGSLAAALGGLDALIFTGGIGENAASIRAEVCRNCTWLGIKLDAEKNNQAPGCISTSDSPTSAWVIPTAEELMIARHTQRLLGSGK